MNLTIVHLFLLRSAFQINKKFFQPGFDLSSQTNSHYLNIINSKFSYFTSELLKIHKNPVKLRILKSTFDHFISQSLSISSRVSGFTNVSFYSHVDFPATTTNLELKYCSWSNFISTSEKGGCFGINAYCNTTILGCFFINITISTVLTTGKGAFMIISRCPNYFTDFNFTNNIMFNITSTNLPNNPAYHAFYVSNNGSTVFKHNSFTLLTKSGSYSCLLQSVTETVISNSNFTNCGCKIGSGLNIELFNQSKTKIRYSLFSNLGGFEILRFSIVNYSNSRTVSDLNSEFATVLIDHTIFCDNDGTFLVAFNNRKSDSYNSDFGMRLSFTYGQFFGNRNMTWPIYVKVPNITVFSIIDFTNCVSESPLIMQDAVQESYEKVLSDGWMVVTMPIKPTKSHHPTKTPRPTKSPKPPHPTENNEPTERPLPPTPNLTPLRTAQPNIEPVSIVKDGAVFTPSTVTSSVLIEGDASINFSTAKTLQFSAYNSSSSSSQINLFGDGIRQFQVSPNRYEIGVRDFSSVTINVLNSTSDGLSLPIVLSEVSNFSINYHKENATKIKIKAVNAPTKLSDLTSDVSSNSKLDVNHIYFLKNPHSRLSRLHQTVRSISPFSSTVDSVTVDREIEAELVNFTVIGNIEINPNSQLVLKQTAVNFRTIIQFITNSIESIGQIKIENSKKRGSSLDSSFASNSFIPHDIKIDINYNSENNDRFTIINGIGEDVCNQIFVTFQPQTNLAGHPYRSYCEKDKLVISAESSPKMSRKTEIDEIYIALIVVGCVVVLAAIFASIFLIKRKSSRISIDPSDAFDVSGTNTNEDLQV